MITSAEGKMTATSAPWLQAHEDWNLHMIDYVLPDLADAQGRIAASFGLITGSDEIRAVTPASRLDPCTQGRLPTSRHWR